MTAESKLFSAFESCLRILCLLMKSPSLSNLFMSMLEDIRWDVLNLSRLCSTQFLLYGQIPVDLKADNIFSLVIVLTQAGSINSAHSI